MKQETVTKGNLFTATPLNTRCSTCSSGGDDNERRAVADHDVEGDDTEGLLFVCRLFSVKSSGSGSNNCLLQILTPVRCCWQTVC